jgi:hypothetical protein
MKIHERDFKLGILSVIMAIGLLLGVHSTSYAGLVNLSLSDGVTTVNITDGGIGDSNLNAGVITYIGSIGVWTLNTTTALGAPATVGNTLMDVSSQNTSTGAGTLTIIANQTGWTPGGTLNFAGEVGGTFQGTTLFRWYAGGNLLGSDTLGPGADAGGGSATASVPTPYDVTLRADITHPAAGLSSYDQSLRVPEPTTLILLGLGLASLGLLGRKKFKKN